MTKHNFGLTRVKSFTSFGNYHLDILEGQSTIHPIFSRCEICIYAIQYISHLSLEYQSNRVDVVQLNMTCTICKIFQE